MTDTKLKVTARGLSANGQTLFELLFAGKQVFPEQEWVFGADFDVMDVMAVIIDTDSGDGSSLWAAFGHEADLPIKILYSANRQETEAAQFALKKPCRSFELAELMRRVAFEVRAIYRKKSSPLLAEIDELSGKHGKNAPRLASAVARHETSPRVSKVVLAEGLSQDDQFRLRRWPNFSHLDYTPRHVKLAVIMSRQTSDLRTLAAASGLPVDEAIGFINTCHAMGYLQVQKGAASAEHAQPTRSPAGGPPGSSAIDGARSEKLGFLQRIRNRLGL